MAAVVLTFTVLYVLGMAVLVGEPVRFSHALEVVARSMATTGYGEDADLWPPAMEVFMRLTMITGVSMISLALPVFLAPWVEERLSTVAPTAVDEEKTDHVVIAGYTTRGKALIDELTTRGIPYVVVEPDRNRAAELYEQGIEVIRSGPGPPVGQSLRGSDLRARTGCTVVAVQRNGSLVADLNPDYVIGDGDELIVTGTDEDITQFTALVEG